MALESLEYIITGPRGAGKTLILTHFGDEKLMLAYAVKLYREKMNNPSAFPKYKTRVVSNYPITCAARFPWQREVVILKSEPLDVEMIMAWDPSIKDCYIIYDEIDQDADRQDWQDQLPKYLVKGIKLMRHRNISLLASLQFDDELNARLYKQADIIIRCKDIARSPWGLSKKLRLGEQISATWIDKSGIMTGMGWDESHKSYPTLFFGQRYWHDYSTVHDFDIMRPKIKVKREERILMKAEDALQEDKNRQCFLNSVAYMVHEYAGEPYISPLDINNALVESGCQWPDSRWRKELKELGVFRLENGKGYDFSNVKLGV